jgi:hypothetical protein
VEELDAEMDDYFGDGEDRKAEPTINAAAPAAGADDIDMIE